MAQELDALDFIGEISQSTGVNVVVGVNAYIEGPDSFSSYVVLIDPSGLSGEDESKLEDYSERRGFRMAEAWNDWGRFVKINKLRPVFISTLSP